MRRQPGGGARTHLDILHGHGGGGGQAGRGDVTGERDRTAESEDTEVIVHSSRVVVGVKGSAAHLDIHIFLLQSYGGYRVNCYLVF